MEEVIVDNKYKIKHLNGVGMVFRNGEAWKEVTKYDLSVAETIKELREELAELKRQQN